MKRISMLCVVLLACVAAMAQKPVMEFAEKSHDFGKINEADGRVTTVFEFSNTGSTPLAISNVRASCGCTTPSWTKTPIEPGQKGNITVTYNPSGRPGRFTKTITVTSNASEEQIRLTIRGEVIPKSAQPVDKYPVKMGNLSLSKKTLQFNNVTKDATPSQMLEYANNTKEDVTVSLMISDSYVVADALPTTIKAGQAGSIYVKLNTAACKKWGPIASDIYVIVDGKVEKSETYKLNVRANIVEDFSKMTTADKQNAPIAEFASTIIDMGTISANSTKSYKLTLSNKGAKNPLFIRRIVNSAKELSISSKASINSGKHSDLNVVVNTKGLEPQTYRRSFTVITNDPDHTQTVISVTWKVQ